MLSTIHTMPPALHAFYSVLLKLKHEGEKVSPRGQECLELTNFSYSLPPRIRFMCFKHRKLNLDYIKEEFCWYLRGDKHDTSIAKLAKIWEGMIDKDGIINSNYGQYLFNKESSDGLTYASNVDRVVSELKRDRDSRRATISILANSHHTRTAVDIPCTAYLNFHIRHDNLIMYVRMRSQDAIFGMGNDAPCFSFIHELVYTELAPYYPKLAMGPYHHSSDSFHVYKRHYEMLDMILEDPVIDEELNEKCPPMIADGHTLDELLIVSNWANSNGIGFSRFGGWLLTRDKSEKRS